MLQRVLSSLLIVAALAALSPDEAAAAGVEGTKVAKIAFRGNRKVEDAAIFAVLSSKVGEAFYRSRVAVDVRAIWGMGYFDDVQVNLLTSSKGVILVYVVREKPSVRKIIVGGFDEIDLDKINEVLDLRRNAILDISQVKRNVEKIRDLYTEKGFYLAEVRYRLRKVRRNRVDILIDIEENDEVTIRRITFIGNSKVKDADIKRVMGTREGGFFSFVTSSGTYQESAFERDMLLITALYYDRGYINVKLSEPQVLLSPDKRYMYITIHVREGKRYKIGKLDVKGDLLWPKKKLLKSLRTKEGQWFQRTRLGKDVMRLSSGYKDRGHAYANISPLTSIDANKRTVSLTFNIQKGPIVTVERINIRGNTKTRDKVIRRELKVAEGDTYSQTLLERSRARVTALGFFESVNLSTRRGSADDRIIVNFEVKERPTGTFQIGAGFSSVENFIAQAQISQNNLFGRGQRLALQAQISGLRQLFSLSFWEPYFLDTRITFGFDVFNSLRAFESFNRNATGGSLTWGYPLLDDVRVFVTYKAEIVDVSTRGRGTLFGSGLSLEIPQGVQLANLFNDGFTSSVRFSVQWDRRNNRLFPSKGFFHAAWAEFATGLLGSQNIFNRFGAFSRWYYPIFGPFIFKVNAQIGAIFSSNNAGVPIFERFFTGGIQDVRGFRPRSLGPRVKVLQRPDPNAPLFEFNKGGNKELVFNVEIEFPIFQKVGIRGVVFTDAGMSYDDDEPISFPRLRHSWGFGFRWFSPIGPLRFEWGLPFSPNPGEDPIVFEFTIGNFF
ncbi:MAG: outer membrane protein assembly factor BamA [Deltaproteobacteria bacterium]|nr:MAG: outer membrane protein assembly factor BamA [Pseudomonadota bacterium]PIE66139.1 MAG: outer membrane protein assembly factor BamA [Deltaproteobacteria bacterium]